MEKLFELVNVSFLRNLARILLKLPKLFHFKSSDLNECIRNEDLIASGGKIIFISSNLLEFIVKLPFDTKEVIRLYSSVPRAVYWLYRAKLF